MGKVQAGGGACGAPPKGAEAQAMRFLGHVGHVGASHAQKLETGVALIIGV